MPGLLIVAYFWLLVGEGSYGRRVLDRVKLALSTIPAECLAAVLSTFGSGLLMADRLLISRQNVPIFTSDAAIR